MVKGDNKTNMKKLLLIDGHSILNRAFFGLPDLTNSEGLHTNAVYGFLNMMFKIMEVEQPDYLTVAFDVHAPTFRHKMYEAYKGTRKPMAPELRMQVPMMKQMLTAMGVTIVEKPGFEADDLLGTLGKRAEEMGMEVTIVSGDRDLLQLATEHIKISIPKTKKTGTEIENYYAKDVQERYQVTPTEFIDVKALMGDTADNIPGVPGIGEKTATNIIASYHSIESAHEHAAELKPPRASANLQEYYDQAVMSKELATINVHSEIDYDLQQAKLENLYTQEAYLLCKEWEFKNLLPRFDMTSPSNDAEEHFQIVNDFGKVEEIFDKMQGTFGVGIYQEQEKFYGISVSNGEDTFLIYAMGFVTKDYLVQKLSDLVAKGNMLCTMDLKKLLKLVPIDQKYRSNTFDAGVAAYLVNPLKNSYPVDDLAKEYLGLMVPDFGDLFGKISWDKAWEEKPEEMCTYCCYEAYTARACQEKICEELQEMGMYHLYEEIELPLIYTLNDMEQDGIAMDAAALTAYGEKLSIRIQELEKTIYEQAGESFNINSPKQLGVILFEKLQLPNGKKTKTGYSTAADVLEKLAGEYPIVSDILEYRQLTKLKSTYADGLGNCIQEDGRVHSTFQQTVTATGRISSTEPNLQNIPIRMELGKLIRKVFLPKPGYVFVDADYSQIELRVLAHMSGDENLIDAYQQNKDIHRSTAALVFHTPFEEVTDLQRRNAKAVNFGIVYGISSFGLSQDLSITKKEAQKYIDDYFVAYPKMKVFLDTLVSDAKEKGYVTTLFGRRRPVPELSSSNFMQRSFGERVAMNSPIQGTAADIIKIAMVKVHDRLRKEGLASRLILQVHDELLIEAKEEELSKVEQILQEEMEQAADLAVSLEIDMHTGYDWYEAK